jgi:hypothetical protein
VTLQSREFIEKLLREYVENTKAANGAQEEAKRAFGDAARFEQQAKDLDAKEQVNLAQIQQAKAELQQVQARLQQAEAGRQQVLAELQEANVFAEQARAYGTAQKANQEGFTGQATDARTVLERFDIAVPDDMEQTAQAPMPAPSNGVDPAGPTSVDLADDPRMNGPLSRFNEAHDEDAAESAGAE